jgi:hypothetical protein
MVTLTVAEPPTGTGDGVMEPASTAPPALSKWYVTVSPSRKFAIEPPLDAASELIVVVVSVSDGVPTVTVALCALSGPVQSACFGVTAYFQVPGATPNSVQVSVAIVPVHEASTVCGTPVEELNRRSVYPATGVVLGKRATAHDTVTSRPLTDVVGVFPDGTETAFA